MAVFAATLAPVPAMAVDQIDSAALRNAVTVNGILTHERALQRIADQNGGTRASGTPGFTASSAYVASQLRNAGYTVTQQNFTFPFFRELAAPELVQVSPAAATYATSTFEFSGSGNVSGRLVPTRDVQIPPASAPASTSGCEANDFVPASPTVAQIALIQRGTCTFEQKAVNAKAAGYDAAIIFNEGQPGRQELLTGTLSHPVGIPVVGLNFATGRALYWATKTGPVVTRVTTQTEANLNAQTNNLIAERPGGDASKVLVVGAHLDSVVPGPGINDNGSGTATVLEIAKQLAALHVTPRQKVRFAFWGAEEPGLIGSQYYVDNLSEVQLGHIWANLNFDMLASPNYVRFVYDGDGSGTGVAGPLGSAQIERVFTSYFSGQGMPSRPTAFDGRSDYGAFIDAGIPAGGLFSGAEEIKTPDEAVTYGGTAGQPYDSCYHQACDTVNNLSTKALQELGDAAAHATLTLALTTTGFNGDGSRAVKRATSAKKSGYVGAHLVS
jgi:Zn-dependent M28 family amino/carboxypeptidase